MSQKLYQCRFSRKIGYKYWLIRLSALTILYLFFIGVGITCISKLPSSAVQFPSSTNQNMQLHLSIVFALIAEAEGKPIPTAAPKAKPTAATVANTTPSNTSSQDNLIAFIVALVGVIGTGIGILASLIPIELTSKRDYYQRLMKIWKLLEFESKSIASQCDSYNTFSEDEYPPISMFSSLPVIAWQVAVSNGEFVAETPQDILSKLDTAYSAAEKLNAIINHYTIYSATSRQNEDFWPRIREFHILTKQQGQVTKPLFQNLEGQVSQQIVTQEKNVNTRQRWINGLRVFGGGIFLFVLIACLVLAALAYLH